MKNRNAFTLIELLMVVAIIAIITTLAVNKMSGLKEKTALEISIANQHAISRAVEAYLVAGGRLDRLDGLTYSGHATGGTAGFQASGGPAMGAPGGMYRGPVDNAYLRSEENAGLMSPLLYSHLVQYLLSPTDVSTLNSMYGLQNLMRHWPYADTDPSSEVNDNGTAVIAGDYRSPNGSACILNSLSSNRWVLAVNPMSDSGRAIYRSCGQRLELPKNESWTFDKATNLVQTTGGPLLAFGLGSEATIIGNTRAGLESAPASAYPLKKHYTRYLLLFRLKSAGAGMSTLRSVEFAGTLDCIGNTVEAAENTLKGL